MNIYLIRHGYPDYDNDTLTEEGKLQAEKLVKRFKDIKIDKLYVSTHGRTIETSKPLIKAYNLKPIYVDWAREDLGAKYFVDKTWIFWQKEYIDLFNSDEIKKLELDWDKHPMIAKTKMPEGYAIMKETVDNFLKELGFIHDRTKHVYKKVGECPKNVILVAHGGFAYSFLSNLLDIPYPLFTLTHDCMEVTAITLINVPECENSIPKITYYNDFSHLKCD